MSEESGFINRRNVLKRLGTVGATGVLVGAGSNTAVAADPSKSGTIQLRSVEDLDAERLFESMAGDLLRNLAEDGLLDSPSAGALATGASGFGSRTEGVTGMHIDDEVGARTKITSTTEIGEGRLKVSVEPERDLAYATLDPADGDETMVYRPGDGLTSMGSLESDMCGGCTCYDNYPCVEGGRKEVCYVEAISGEPCTTIEGCC